MSIKDILTLDFEDELLDEELLDENIPRDLLKAYQTAMKADKGGVGDQSTHSEHGELQLSGSSYKKRRYVKWDYGKSNYEELTKDQALDYLGIPGAKQSEIAEKLPNLRLIINGQLAEWENHNGKIYYLYWLEIPWAKLREIGSPGFKGKNGYTNDTKFAQKVTDIETCIKCADKIYKTDEYEHPLYGNDVYQARKDAGNVKEKNKYVDYGLLPADERPADYNSHTPYKNFKSHSQFSVEKPDTGAHNINQRFTSNSKEWGVNRKVELYYNRYLELIKRRDELKNLMQNYMAISRKLVREKDDYDEETYKRKEDKLKALIKDTQEHYDKVVNNIKKEEKQVKVDITNKMQDFNQNVLGEYLRKWEDVQKRGYDLEKAISAEKANVAAGETQTRNLKLFETRISQILDDLATDKELFKDLTLDKKDIDNQDVLYSMEQLSNKLDELEQAKQNVILKHLQTLRQLESDLAQTNDEWATIRKKEAEMKAQRQSKNKVNELDPKLTGVIQFKDFVGDEAETTA